MVAFAAPPSKVTEPLPLYTSSTDDQSASSLALSLASRLLSALRLASIPR